jgi:hypothetical protein
MLIAPRAARPLAGTIPFNLPTVNVTCDPIDDSCDTK